MTVAIIQQLVLSVALINKAVVIFSCDLESIGDKVRDTWSLFLPSLVVLASWILSLGECLEDLHKVDAVLQTVFLLRALMFLIRSGQLYNVLRIYDQLAIHFN